MQSVADAAKTPILFIGNEADAYEPLCKIFRRPGWQLQSAPALRQGIVLLRRCADIPVVICEEMLPDGDWKRVIGELQRLPRAVTLIVASRLANDRLWAEVLNWGAFDLIFGEPFVAEEVIRVTESACRTTVRKNAERGRSTVEFPAPLAAPPLSVWRRAVSA